MTGTKIASRKAKGRRLPAWLKAVLLSVFPELKAIDITCTPGGVNGPDLTFSEKAAILLPYGVECKNQEGFKKVYDAVDQATKALLPEQSFLVVLKSNNKKPLAVLDAEEFVKLVAETAHLRRQVNSLEITDDG